MRRPRLLAIAAFALSLAPAAWGYIRLTIFYSNGATAPIKRSDGTAGVQFFINNLIVPGLQSSASGSTVTVISSGSNPVAAIRAAGATWNASGTGVKFLAMQSTSAVINPTDGQNTIAVGSTAADLSMVGGAVAVTINTAAGFVSGSTPTGSVTDSDVILNPSMMFSTDGSTSIDLQSVLTHEFGHALGLDHTGLLGDTMFQYTQLDERYLGQDELSFANAVYPTKAGTQGTIGGKVVAADGSAVQSALVELIDPANGNSLSALTASDGTYSLQVPPGSYTVTAEPMGSGSIVQPGNLYLPASTVVTTSFQATTLGGFGSPMTIPVTVGNTATVPNLTVTAGTTALTIPFAGIGKAGGAGDILSPVSETPLTVASGQSVDIGLIGGGIDATTTIQVIGQGISVVTGSTRVDKSVSFGGSLAGDPLIRTTLTIAARQAPTLATVIITKGSNSLALSGLLVIGPPTPAFTSAAVVSAASYKGPAGSGGVSPGGIYSIYDTVNNSLGPNPFVQPSGYDLYGNLGTSLGGVTVTFDGVPAPLFLAYSGQLNIQVPFEVAGKTSTKVVVTYNGSASAPVTVPVAATQPAFFTVTPEGTDAIIQNFPDYSLNSASNPLARGGVALFYGTGLGNLGYSLATGQPGIVPPSSYSSKYSCSFGGVSASAYAYWNYGFVGEATWTVTVPSNAPTGAVMLTCTDSASGNTTQQGTIYLK